MGESKSTLLPFLVLARKGSLLECSLRLGCSWQDVFQLQ